MIDVANLKPSDVETLIEEGISPATKDAILSGISRMVKEVRPDRGADSDRIHLTANMLAMADAWTVIQPAELARALDGGEHENIVVFLEGLPSKYNREVAYEMIMGSDAVEAVGSDEVEIGDIGGFKVVSVGYRINPGRVKAKSQWGERNEKRRQDNLERLKKWRARRNTQRESVVNQWLVTPNAPEIEGLDPELPVYIGGTLYVPVGRSSETERFNPVETTIRSRVKPRKFT